MNAPAVMGPTASVAHAAATTVEERRRQLVNQHLYELEQACRTQARRLRAGGSRREFAESVAAEIEGTAAALGVLLGGDQ